VNLGYAIIAGLITGIAGLLGDLTYHAIKMNAAFNWPASGVFAVSFCMLAAIAVLALAVFLWYQAWDELRS